MDKLKKFLTNKKVSKHFKNSGQGARLSDKPTENAPSVKSGTAQSSSSGMDRIHAADVAAQAALKRLHANEPVVSSSQKKIQMLAQRELEKEKREMELANAKFADDVKNLAVNEPEMHDLNHSNAISGVKYTCELLGEDVALGKEELRAALEVFLREQLDEDALVASSLLITSLNKPEERRVACDTIKKYLQNLLEHQGDPKYRRIKVANKAFQERVEAVKGGREFLESLGFCTKRESATEDGAVEEFLVISEESAADDGKLLGALELLDGATPIQLKVARDTKIFTLKEGERVNAPRLPSDFYAVTGEELKKEQERLTVQVDRMTTMRTREMREKDAKQAEYRYKYTLVRVRTSDRCIIQGVFGVHETLAVVRDWLHPILASAAAEFALLDSTSPFMDETKSLAELGLVPAVTIHLDYRGDSSHGIIAPEYMAEALPFTLD